MKVVKVDFEGDIMTVIDRFEGESGERQLKKDPPFSAYGYQRLDVSRTMAAIGLLAERVGKVDRVMETFGGVGWHSRYIRQICEPDIHWVCDISQDCVDSVKASEPLEGVRAFTQDAWKIKFDEPKFDWIHVDAQSFTLDRFANDIKFMGHLWRDLIDNMVAGTSRYLSVTDSAVFGLVRFQKNRQAYADKFGMDPENWLDYWRCLSEHFYELYGMAAVYVVWWAGQAGCILFDKEAKPGKKLEIIHVKEKAKIKLISIDEVEE